MKNKEGRDYITLKDCIVHIYQSSDGEEFVQFANMSEAFNLSKEEFDKMVKFVSAKFSEKE